MRKIKILLHAYINKNIGDDLFLALILKRYPDVKFYLYVPKRIEEYYAKFSENLTIIPYKETWEIFQKLDGKFCNGWFTTKHYYTNLRKLHKKYTPQMDAQIWLGGSQFVETSNWKRILDYKKYQQTTKIPFYAISATVGPVYTQQYLEEVRHTVAGYDEFCCRDLKSYQLLEGLSNVRVVPDMVFSIPVNDLPKEDLICISVINVTKRFGREVGEKYETLIFNLANMFIAQDYNVVLISFCDAQRDFVCCKRIYSKILNRKKVAFLTYNSNLQEIINLFSKAKYVVGTRYHSIILGLRYGAKVFPIIYESKTKNLLDDIQKTGIPLDDIAKGKLQNWEDKWIELDKNQINEIAKKSEDQFLRVDEFINQFDG